MNLYSLPVYLIQDIFLIKCWCFMGNFTWKISNNFAHSWTVSSRPSFPKKRRVKEAIAELAMLCIVLVNGSTIYCSLTPSELCTVLHCSLTPTELCTSQSNPLRAVEASIAANQENLTRLGLPKSTAFVDPANPHDRKRAGTTAVGLKNIGNTCWFSAVVQVREGMLSGMCPHWPVWWWY